MMPKHKVFHIVFFIVAINFLFACPCVIALIENKAQQSCSLYSSAELKKKLCRAHLEQLINPSTIVHSGKTLFLAPAVGRLGIPAAHQQDSNFAFFITSMRLNL